MRSPRGAHGAGRGAGGVDPAEGAGRGAGAAEAVVGCGRGCIARETTRVEASCAYAIADEERVGVVRRAR
ncbi:MAG: hypothetical protein WBB76_04360 [Gaiellaceae bacterium]